MAKFVAFFILFLLLIMSEAKKKKSKENGNDSPADSIKSLFFAGTQKNL